MKSSSDSTALSLEGGTAYEFMPLTNAEIAAQLGQLAELLRSQGVNRFKIKAYRTAATALRSYPQRISELLEHGKPLPKIPGIGESIAAAITEIAESGTLATVKRLGEKLPAGTSEIAEAAKVTIREAQQLVKALGISTPAELRTALDAGRVTTSVGERLEFKVRHGLLNARRLLWEDAAELAQQFGQQLKSLRGVSQVENAGSLRRGKDTVGTLRFVLQGGSRTAVMGMLRRHGGIESVKEESPSRLVCKLAAGPLLVVRLAKQEDWGTAMAEETGSRAHLAELRWLVKASPRRAFATEKAWYAARGLPMIPPELREGRSEVQAALEGLLPELVDVGDIRGDLHAHTTESDGANTLEEMVDAARARGYEYLAITDHSKNLKITNGLDEKRLLKQMKTIDRLNRSLKGFRVLKGSEVDILEDGSLDFGGDVLKQLDVVMASVHSRFGLSKEQQTKRLLRAIKNPYLTCIGHLTGRKLLKRPGYEFDVERVMKEVKRQGKLLEINASPDRLDINDELAQQALALGIPLLINTDAHSTREFEFMRHGVRQARRGWESAPTVLNTLPLPQLLERLAATRNQKKG